MNDKNIIQMPDGYLNKTPLFQFILLSCLFPLWGCAAALNDILITQFKSVFSLSNFASALVQSAFYGGYFLIAIPASLVIKKTSYKVAILIGLTLYIGGCTLFFPASHMATYTMFLAAIFAIAIGLSFLETAANTYSSMIGPKAYATLRLNISQTFYLKWSTKTGHRVRVFSSIDFPIRLVVTHHYIRAVLVRCNIQRYSPLLRELHR